MKNHNFIIGPTDTDSISFCKPDGTEFSPEERKILLQELNDISPDFMEWEDDGYYLSCIALRAKNYVLFDGQKKTIKGSAFKTSSKEPALGVLMQEFVDEMLNDNNIDTLVQIYTKYVKEAIHVKDIMRWSQKKTITESITNCEDYKIKHDLVIDKDGSEKQVKKFINSKGETLRKNEIDVWEAIKDEEDKQQGNKAYLYPVILRTDIIPGGISPKTGKPLKDKVVEVTGLKLAKHWSNDHDVEKLVERCYATIKIFSSVLDISKFTDYTKKCNKHLLEELKNEI